MAQKKNKTAINKKKKKTRTYDKKQRTKQQQHMSFWRFDSL